MEKFNLGDIVRSTLFSHALGEVLVVYKKDGEYYGKAITGILDGRNIYLGTGSLFEKIGNIFNKGERK